MRSMIVFALSAMLCGTAAAQSPSAVLAFPSEPPPKLPVFSGPNPTLLPKEKKGLAYGTDWASNRAGPARGDEGATLFVFGSTLPSLVCAPLYVCDLTLQEGEAVNDLNVGDSVRWKITPATQGSAESLITHVMIKPTDVGLVTNLVITTNRRTYIIKLVSRAQDWMPRVAFQYPDDVESQWKLYRAKTDAVREANAAAPAQAPKPLDFNYMVEGNAAWKPQRVYTDGLKTYVQFPAQVGAGELPALVEIGEDDSFLGLDSIISGPQIRLVNYRYTEHRFEVDKVLTKARLTAGVGDNATTIIITRSKRD